MKRFDGVQEAEVVDKIRVMWLAIVLVIVFANVSLRLPTGLILLCDQARAKKR